MKKKMLFCGAACAAVSLLSGCASIICDSEYDVTISTNAPDAVVKVRDSSSGLVISEGAAPHVVQLTTTEGFFDAKSYLCEVLFENKKQTRAINTKINPWFFGNFFIGGILGMAIDGATGAIYKFDDSVYVHFSEFE